MRAGGEEYSSFLNTFDYVMKTPKNRFRDLADLTLIESVPKQVPSKLNDSVQFPIAHVYLSYSFNLLNKNEELADCSAAGHLIDYNPGFELGVLEQFVKTAIEPGETILWEGVNSTTVLKRIEQTKNVFIPAFKGEFSKIGVFSACDSLVENPN